MKQNFQTPPDKQLPQPHPPPLSSCDKAGRGPADGTCLLRVYPPMTQNPSQCAQPITFILSKSLKCYHNPGHRTLILGRKTTLETDGRPRQLSQKSSSTSIRPGHELVTDRCIWLRRPLKNAAV